MKPQRIQLSRRKGFDLQAASKDLNGLYAVNCARPGPWGNPFIVGVDGTRTECCRLHSVLLGGYVALTTKATPDAQMKLLTHARVHIDSLTGRSLACWCAASVDCHVDTYLDLANPPGASA